MAQHWADDQVVVALQRVASHRLHVGVLQETTGLGPSDLEACLTGLRERGVVTEDGGDIIWVEGPASEPEPVPESAEVHGMAEAAQNGAPNAGPDPLPVSAVVSRDVAASVQGALNAVVLAVRNGEAIVVRADVDLDAAGNVVRVHRVLGISLQP